MRSDSLLHFKCSACSTNTNNRKTSILTSDPPSNHRNKTRLAANKQQHIWLPTLYLPCSIILVWSNLFCSGTNAHHTTHKTRKVKPQYHMSLFGNLQLKLWSFRLSYTKVSSNNKFPHTALFDCNFISREVSAWRERGRVWFGRSFSHKSK